MVCCCGQLRAQLDYFVKISQQLSVTLQGRKQFFYLLEIQLWQHKGGKDLILSHLIWYLCVPLHPQNLQQAGYMNSRWQLCEIE